MIVVVQPAIPMSEGLEQGLSRHLKFATVVLDISLERSRERQGGFLTQRSRAWARYRFENQEHVLILELMDLV
jgi:hypothetical protein